MVEKNQFLKILSVAGFLCFAAVSCWATAESLHLLLPSWPEVFCWAVTIGFFVIASYGSKLLVDSLNTNIYVERRSTKLVIGIVLLILFWLICSMPTNMHTFFYRSGINNIAMQDVSTTKSYLRQLADNTLIEKEKSAKIEALKRDVESALTGLENEIDNMANPGFGDRAKEHLTKLAKALGVDVIPTLSYQGTSAAQRKLLKDQYRKIAYQHMNNRISEIQRTTVDNRAKTFVPEAKALVAGLDSIQKPLDDAKAYGKVDNELIAETDVLLTRSYSMIKDYSDLIDVKGEDRATYLVEHPVSRTHRMLSVIDVWKDLFAGKFQGLGVAYWIVISILVDVAAFVFFDIAFKKEDF